MLAAIVLAVAFPHSTPASVEVIGSAWIPDTIITGDGRGAGSRIEFYLRNNGTTPVSVTNASWNKRTLAEHMQGPAYDLIWWRTTPEVIPAGGEAVLTLSLRTALERGTDFQIELSNEQSLRIRLRPETPAFRFAGIVFGEDLRSAVCYLEQLTPGGRPPREIWLNGKLLRGDALRWLGTGYTAGILPVVVTPPDPFQRGTLHVFRAADRNMVSAAALRAFQSWTRFGTCGYHEFDRFASAGLNQYFSFTPLSRGKLDQLAALGMTAAMMVPPELEIPEDVGGHPALHAWVVTDEPDVQDYTADPSRPENLRVGTMAPKMVAECAELAQRDPMTPAVFTLNLNFVPENYCIYGPIPDLLMPDSYPVTHGQPLTNFRDYAAMARRAAAPRPFMMVYQGCWEEWALPQEQWLGRDALLEKGWEPFIDTTRLRGFGRAPEPGEIFTQLLYAIGNGSKGALSYTDATEIGQGWVFHGSVELPEVWQAITSTSRDLRILAPIIEMGHPIHWAESKTAKLWVSTIITTNAGALVVVVNEDHIANENGFQVESAQDVGFTFADLPWMRAGAVFRLGDGALTPVGFQRSPGRIAWSEPAIEAGVVYFVAADDAMADKLLADFNVQPPTATPEGMQPLPETYLQGRRRTLPTTNDASGVKAD